MGIGTTPLVACEADGEHAGDEEEHQGKAGEDDDKVAIPEWVSVLLVDGPFSSLHLKPRRELHRQRHEDNQEGVHRHHVCTPRVKTAKEGMVQRETMFQTEESWGSQTSQPHCSSFPGMTVTEVFSHR